MNGTHVMMEADDTYYKNYSFEGTAETYFENKNITQYYINLSELATKNNMLLFRINIWIYSFILKLVPSIVLTVITGFLIQALYKADRRSARLKNGLQRSVTTRAHNLTPPAPNAGNNGQARSQSVTIAVPQQARSNNNTASNNDQNAALARKKSTRRKSTDRTTRLLIVILVLFLLTEFPQVGFDIYDYLMEIRYPFFSRASWVCFLQSWMDFSMSATCPWAISWMIWHSSTLQSTSSFITSCPSSLEKRSLICLV